MEQLRGYEGEAASVYFGVFDQLILQQKKDFKFEGRNRRPPLDNVNAMLSFFYTLLTNMCASALESVGLDPYVGFMHTDRPGRVSLALDMMEELRPVLVDRFVPVSYTHLDVYKRQYERSQQREIVLKLKDIDAEKLSKISGRVGISVSELLNNFVSDLIGGERTNGSDERMRCV